MGENTLSALGVIDRAAGEISSNRDAHHCGRRVGPVRAPANQRQFVAKLLHGWPDVIEELYLHHWLESPLRHAHGAAYNIRFRQWRIEDPLAAKLDLQARRQLENAAFALDLLLLQIFF